MPGKQSPPGKGRQGKPLFFAWVGTEKGKQWNAHVAGRAQWYECHHVGKSKPCLFEVTGGELECPHCAAGKFTETIGYIPLYRTLDAKPCCVLLHDDVRDVVDRLKYLDFVVVGRGLGKSDGVYVAKSTTKGPGFHSTLEAKNTEADIWCSLVRMWKIPALTEWDARQSGRKTGGVLHPTKQTPTVPTVPTVPRSAPAAPGEQPLGDLLNRVLDVVKGREQKADDRTALDPPDAPGEAV